MDTTSVYRAYLAEELVYVGVSKNALRRISEHGWRADRIEVDHYPSREIAETEERRLIEKHQPSYNIVHNLIERRTRKIHTEPYLGTAAEILRVGRTSAGLTQAALAAVVGTSQQVISAYETGRVEPTLPTLMALLAAADVELRFHLDPVE